jgi:hypothetical protein
LDTGSSLHDVERRWAAAHDAALHEADRPDQVRDIQEIIDQLTAVTKQLNEPGTLLPGDEAPN